MQGKLHIQYPREVLILFLAQKLDAHGFYPTINTNWFNSQTVYLKIYLFQYGENAMLFKAQTI